MIPTMGIMIGGYIIFRCLEIACRPATAFSSREAYKVVLVAAVVGILVTGFMVVDLFMSSLSSTATVPSLR